MTGGADGSVGRCCAPRKQTVEGPLSKLEGAMPAGGCGGGQEWPHLQASQEAEPVLLSTSVVSGRGGSGHTCWNAEQGDSEDCMRTGGGWEAGSRAPLWELRYPRELGHICSCCRSRGRDTLMGPVAIKWGSEPQIRIKRPERSSCGAGTALNSADLGSIPGTPYSPPGTPGSDPSAQNPGVTPSTLLAVAHPILPTKT